MAILMATFWVLVIVGLAVMVKHLIGGRPTERDVPFESVSPADVLAARFARGEISETDYRDRAAVLWEGGQK